MTSRCRALDTYRVPQPERLCTPQAWSRPPGVAFNLACIISTRISDERTHHVLSIANPALSYRVSDVFRASESRFALAVGMPKSRTTSPNAQSQLR